jgi:aryl-alcohol dehydrogenase-like predicted oxidoreductase
MLAKAASGGIDTIDTAIAYGDSEARLGHAGVGGSRIVTKLTEVPTGVDVSDWVFAQIQGSLARLRVASVYGVLLHRPQQLMGTQGREIASALDMIKHCGLVEKIGVSIYGPEDLNGLAISGFDLVQAPYNLIDRRFYTSGVAQRLFDSGVEIHARSAFLQGLLLMSTERRPRKFDRWHEIWSRWESWLRDQCISPVQACLGFVLAHPSIARVVVGAETMVQLEDLLAAAQTSLPADWPDLACDDLALINPSCWTQL